MENQRDNVALTTYVAGQLDGEERNAVEARLAKDPAARAEIGLIRRVVALLITLFQSEGAPHLDASQRTAIEAAPRRARRWRLSVAIGLAAAAAILVAAGLFMFAPGRDGQPPAPLARQADTNDLAAGPETPEHTGTLPPAREAPLVRGNRAALPISLPDAAGGGTPEPIKNEPNMGPKRKGKRPPFFAPTGTVNLAAGKPVTSSDAEPIIGELKYVTDGEKQSTDGYFVELAPGKQWIMVDLKQTATIYAIVVWHYHRGNIAYRDVVVQVGADQDFITSKTVFNNDHDNSGGFGVGKGKEWIEVFEGKLIDTKGVRGRYVRLASKGNTSNDLNHYIEVEVYGKPAK